MVYKILIVEDDRGIAQAIKNRAEMWNLETKCIENFRDIVTEFTTYQPHLILMDISLPFFNGYHWCNEIRKISNVPIIFISSMSDNMNIVMAINMGADDFIAKPFNQEILISKIQALLRRTYNFIIETPKLEIRGALLNTLENTLIYKNKQIDLTKNEYRILLTLMENKNKVVSREQLMEKLWETDSFVDENTLNVNVNRLRKKLDNADLKDFIKTKFGVGYIIFE